MRQKRWIGLLLVVVLAVATACSGGSDDEGDSSASGSESSSASPSDVPEVVAEVNGEEISRDDFVEAYQAQQAVAQQQGGQQPDEKQLREQVAQSLVNEELLTQEADRRGIEASDKQVQQTLEEAAQQNGMQSADQLVSALEKQGLDEKEIDDQAALQTRFDLLVTDVAGPIKATDQQVRTLYQQLKSQQSGSGKGGQQVPPLAQVRPQLEAQVESQQQSQAAQDLIDKLRKDADITVHV